MISYIVFHYCEDILLEASLNCYVPADLIIIIIIILES